MSQPSFTPAPPGPYGAPQYQSPQSQAPQYQQPQYQQPQYQQPQYQTPQYQQPPEFREPGYPASIRPPGPPPLPAPAVPYAPQLALQRPAVVAMSAAMTVTASLQWICALSFAWLVATAGASNLSLQGSEGGLFHLLHRFHISMVDGLAWPLYGIPLLAFFAGFLVLAPRPWARWVLTGTGLLALGWSAWWLQGDLIWWLAPALYILVACLILWTPGASRWYRQRGVVHPHRPF